MHTHLTDTLSTIPYLDFPELRIDEHESTEMPFRYVAGPDGKPVMPGVSNPPPPASSHFLSFFSWLHYLPDAFTLSIYTYLPFLNPDPRLRKTFLSAQCEHVRLANNINNNNDTIGNARADQERCR